MLKCGKAQIQRNWKHKKAHFVARESKNGNNLRLANSVALGSTRLRVLQAPAETVRTKKDKKCCIRFDPSEGTASGIKQDEVYLPGSLWAGVKLSCKERWCALAQAN